MYNVVVYYNDECEMRVTMFNGDKSKIQGQIRYLDLVDFWINLSQNDRDELEYYNQLIVRKSVGSDVAENNSFTLKDFIDNAKNGLNNPKLTEGVYSIKKITGKQVYEEQFKFFLLMSGFASSEKNYVLADLLISYANEIDKSAVKNIDLHYFYQTTAECYYKQRDFREDAIDLTVKYCMLDINLFPYYKDEMISEFGKLPQLMTFKRLCIIYEKNKQFQEAIDICNFAIKNNFDDGTKGGYSARLDKLEKKLAQKK